MNPGLLVGAVAASVWWRRREPAGWYRHVVAAAGLGVLVVGWRWIVPAWLIRVLLSGFVPEAVAHTPAVRLALTSDILRSVAAELMAGPAWLLARDWLGGSGQGAAAKAHLANEEKRSKARAKAVAGSGLKGWQLTVFRGSHHQGHPRGMIRLGRILDPIEGARGRGRAFDIEQPFTHGTILGKPGTGKTTDIVRIAEGALAAGEPVLMLDPKGVGTGRREFERLAQRFQVPFLLVDPSDPASLRYNPCQGSPGQVANKLLGAFEHGAEGQIYKNAAQAVLPVVVRALEATEEEVGLETLVRYLNPQAMLGLANRSQQQRLLDIGRRPAPWPATLAGMQARLEALLEGEFGGLFVLAGDQLDLGRALSRPSVTYISLPAMAASEDVELMARVYLQDLKQVAARRIGQTSTQPAVVFLDELAALREAQQLNDLLLQAREARLACITASQFLPSHDAPQLRHALLSAPIIIAHQVSAEDAEAVASVFGTRRAAVDTLQLDFHGESHKGSYREVDRYRINPNDLRELSRGVAAVRKQTPGHPVNMALVAIAPADMK